MQCPDVRFQLDEYLDGELSPNRTALLERHLASCDECRAELARLRTVVEALGAWLVIAEPVDLTADVMSRVRTRPVLPPFRIPWSYPATSLAGAVLVFAVMLTWRHLAPTYLAHLLHSQIVLRLEMLRLEALLITQDLVRFGPLTWGMISLAGAALVIALAVAIWEVEAFHLWEPGL